MARREPTNGIARLQRLAAVGQLAAGVSHDLRNSLGGVMLRLQLVARDRACSDAQRENLDVIGDVLRDAMEALSRLQDVARGRVSKRAGKADLAAVIGDAAKLAHSGLKDSLLVIDARVPALPQVAGSPAELKHLFLNLFLNASDAMPRGGTVRVRARRSGKSAVVTVADEGRGVPARVRPHIFEPFFTTKGACGLGLGLAMAQAILEANGGAIALEDKPGGASFRLTLPFVGPQVPGT